MDAKTISAYLRADPFVPFKMVMSRTGSHVVSSGAYTLLTEKEFYVGEGADADGILSNVVRYALVQVTRVEAV